jgi:serine/threonine-protein kinase
VSKFRSNPKREPDKPIVEPDEPLILEDSSEGSTDPIAPPLRDSAASATSGSELGASRLGDSTEGTTTGGFETLLGKLVVDAGLVTPDELELCSNLIRESRDEDEPSTLGDLLLDNDYVTRRQLKRVQEEFEAKRSSQRIPGYRIRKKLGSGAMATVFQARQLSLDRMVAIKVLPKKFTDNTRFVDRFYKEGRAAAQLNHPNIVSAYDVGKAGDHHYFVMEFVDGETVYDRIVRKKRVDEKTAIKIVAQVAEALKHAHRAGFVHRDIKPKNIMINQEGVVKLADLGLARATSDREAAKAEAGRAYGTPYYISPEQIRGAIEIGPAADIYGLGATFYHMVCGKVPFEGKNPSSVMHKHLKEELVPPDHVNPRISAGCAQVIEKMMAKDAAERFASATDLLVDLDLIARNEPPHFAHRPLDLSDIVPAADAATPRQAPVVQHIPQRAFSWRILFWVVLGLLGVSLIINLIWVVLKLTTG